MRFESNMRLVLFIMGTIIVAGCLSPGSSQVSRGIGESRSLELGKKLHYPHLRYCY